MRVPIPGLRIVEDPEPREEPRAGGAPSPGAYLREQRLRRGLSLELLAEGTKIPRASLEALEEGRYEALPGPVFVKGFLRCYARSLEVDGDLVIDLLYEEERARVRVEHEAGPASAAVTATAAAPGAPRRTSAASLGLEIGSRALGALGALGARLPRANFLMWIIVGVLVFGAVFAVYVAASAQRIASPHS
ncbi:MAG: helix-turn-helix domain-containing protein [Nannocystis sp.]|nr:helix-turn-helix domain-containing protein [Nannocystis sp.]